MSSQTKTTTLINRCGGKRLFSFLPPHGVELPNNSAVCYIGNLEQRFIPSWPYHKDRDRKPNQRKVKGLDQAVKTDQLEKIESVQSPRHAEMSVKIKKANNLLGSIDPNLNSAFRTGVN